MNCLLRAVSFATLCLGLTLSQTSLAQNPQGTLRGTVEDITGARIESAKIVVRSLATSVVRVASSEERGEFRIDDLPPGSYQMSVDAPGFAQANAEVNVAVSSIRELNVTLKPARAGERVTVAAAQSSITAQPIDPASASRGGVVGSSDLQSLPLPARSFANIAYLAPGTEPVEPSDPTKARITAVSTGGSSGLNNEISVDGGDNSDDYVGGFLQNFSPDAIQEFAFRTALAEADTGRTTAGSVVITTRSGSNVWHGEAAFYERAAGTRLALA